MYIIATMDLNSTIFETIIQPTKGTFSVEHARYVLSLDFRPEEHQRCDQLSQKASEGTLNPAERSELDALLAANAILTILQSKARVSLRKNSTAA